MKRMAPALSVGLDGYLKRLTLFVLIAVCVLLAAFLAYGTLILGYRFPQPYLITSSVQLLVALLALAMALADRVVRSLQFITVALFLTIVVEPLVVRSDTFGFSLLLIAPALIALLVAMGLVYRRRMLLSGIVVATVVIALVFIIHPTGNGTITIDLEGVGPLLALTTIAAGGGVLFWDDVVTRLLETTASSEQEARKLADGREVLLRESNHRIKNNLQVISSMLTLQLDEADAEATKRILTDARNRIDALAMVHRSLQDSMHLDRADAGSFLNEMVQAIVAGIGSSALRVETRMDVATVELPARLLVSIGLIVNELVTNAVVHGLTPHGGGTLTVAFDSSRESGGYVLRVEDSGIGIDTETVGMGSTSLGLTLVRTIAGDQLSAEFDVSSRAGGGTVARVVIPAQPAVGVED